MPNFNKVFLMGVLMDTPESKQIQSGLLVTGTVAVDRQWTSKTGEAKQETALVDFACFGKTAEIVAQYGIRGSIVFMEGKLKSSQWKGQDGNPRRSIGFTVDYVQFVNGTKPAIDPDQLTGKPVQGDDGW